MDLKMFVTKGLGDNSYILASQSDAVIVDPQRDVWRFTSYLEEHNLKLRYVLESHVHNDYISGALELKDSYKGVQLALPSKGDYEFEHKKMQEGDSLTLGQYQLEVIETPGHTYEHISWLVKEQSAVVGAFTGGSLIVGSAGRTDLLGHEHTPELTKLQYETMQRLRQLPDTMRILPTHGSGSFCTASNPSDARMSILSHEKSTNQALLLSELEQFMAGQLDGLRQYPTYYKYMAPLNRKGPKVYGELPVPPALSLEEFQQAINGATIVDLRSGTEFAAGHIPDAVNFEFAASTSNYIGWLLPIDTKFLFVTGSSEEEQISEVTSQLFRIGYDNLVGYLKGGMQTWETSGLPTKAYRSLPANQISQDLSPNNLLDVRDPVEILGTSIGGTGHLFVGDVMNSTVEHEGALYPFCVSGQRAATAASVLYNKGKEIVLITNGGIEELVRRQPAN